MNDWEPMPAGLEGSDTHRDIKYEEHRAYQRDRAKMASVYIEVLRMKSHNTLEDTKEMGWYLWRYFINTGWSFRRFERGWYRESYDKDREKYESRFDNAVEEWKQGRKSKRFGINFLASLCGKHKGTISRLLNGWAKAYKRRTGILTPADKARMALSHLGWGMGSYLSNCRSFDPETEYVRIMETHTDLIEAGNEAIALIEKWEERKRRAEALLKKLKQGVPKIEAKESWMNRSGDTLPRKRVPTHKRINDRWVWIEGRKIKFNFNPNRTYEVE